MTAVIARILARYAAGALAAYGLVDAATGSALALDPDIALALGAALGALAEGAYAFARRFGWAT